MLAMANRRGRSHFNLLTCVMRVAKEVVEKAALPRINSKRHAKSEMRRMFRQTVRKRAKKNKSTEIREKYGKVPEVRRDYDMTTTFEPIGAPLAPAVVVEPAYELKWKESAKTNAEAEVQCSKKKEKEKQYGDEIGAEKSEKVNQPSSDSTPELRDFKAGCKIMEHVKKKGILEEILSENDNRLIREFFERGLVCPDEKIMDVLNEALDMCYGRLTTEEQSSLMADRETSALLQDKERTKSAMLDAILIHPDYNPNAWGGQKPLLNISDKVEKLNEIDQQLPIVEAKSSKLKECNESSTQSQNSTFDPCEEQPAHFSRVVAVKPVESEALKTAQLQGDEQVANSTQKLCKGTQRDGIKSVDLLKYSDKAKESREKQAEKDKKQKSAITPKEQPKVSSEKKQLDQDKKEKSVVAAKDKEQAKGSSKVKQPDKEKKQKSVMTPKEKDQAKGTSEAKQPEKDKKEKSAEASKQKENVESRESANKKSDDVKEKTAKTFKENEKAKTPTKRSEGGGSRKHRSRSSENPKTRCSLKEKRSSIDKSKALEKADAGSKHHASRKSRRESWAQHKSKSHKRRTHKSRSQSAVSRSSARKS